MIVGDDASVIARCLASVRPLIAYWIIADTGATDETPAIVRKMLDGIPGELHRRPWINFAHNRNEALDLARPHGDYTLIIDAAEKLDLPPACELPFLDADFTLLRFATKIGAIGGRNFSAALSSGATKEFFMSFSRAVSIRTTREFFRKT